MKISVLTYNTLFAGYDGVDDHRACVQVDLINELTPDVFLMQEAKGLDANGQSLMFALEARIGMRGFLAIAPHTGQHVTVFIRAPLVPLRFEADSVHFHHALANLSVALPDSDRTMSLRSAHLCPTGANVRRREAAYLAVQAAPETLSLLAGDFNAVSPHDPEPEGFDALAAHHRNRYVDDDLLTADRSVLKRLEAAGWVDIGHRLGASGVPTVPAAGFGATEFARMRCDFVMASKALADCASGYEVIRTPATDRASDHYPVLATFEVRS